MKRLSAEFNGFKKWLKSHLENGDDAGKDHSRIDLGRVAAAARVLQISEFEVFRIAHIQWYGRAAGEEKLEHEFDCYMFAETVPHYVRDFSRKVLDQEERGTLDVARYNIRYHKPTPEQRRAGIWYIVIIAIVIVLFCIQLIEFTPY